MTERPSTSPDLHPVLGRRLVDLGRMSSTGAGTWMLLVAIGFLEAAAIHGRG
ncbi:hypothetical protein V1260_09790 [Brachybacterium sp. J144]|uniref:hypothetical protein n=1 Tax=Brachybacterium sp. J144 TaxID=3116487 RepID=UPI002E7852C1|nr:hypothetical protein [Brachybacterium sp. J144]MEE1651077.1 hypothetical protein [Brachybacterium sp. J144]